MTNEQMRANLRALKTSEKIEFKDIHVTMRAQLKFMKNQSLVKQFEEFEMKAGLLENQDFQIFLTDTYFNTFHPHLDTVAKPATFEKILRIFVLANQSRARGEENLINIREVTDDLGVSQRQAETLLNDWKFGLKFTILQLAKNANTFHGLDRIMQRLFRLIGRNTKEFSSFFTQKLESVLNSEIAILKP